jgi:hypothetical protein
MPIRRVQQQSDSGSIQNLQNRNEEELPPTDYELRVKELYEHALVTRNQALVDSLSLIPLNGAANDPVSIFFRHREYVKSLSASLAEKIRQAAKEIASCLHVDESSLPQEIKWSRYKQSHYLTAITEDIDIVKVASADGQTYTRTKRSFRRVIE